MILKQKLKKFIPDIIYIKIVYNKIMGKRLNLTNPITFNEKLQWLKLHDHNPIYIEMVDKDLVKNRVKKILGEEYVIPSIGRWDKFDDIDFDKLPERFVLKCTHDSGGIVICKDKSKFDINKARKHVNRCMNSNFYYVGREWPYKSVIPRIIAEPYIEDTKRKELQDYKFFCFDGEVKFFKVDFDRFIKHRANYYDTDMKLLDLGEVAFPRAPKKEIEFPENFRSMIKIAQKLSTGFKFIRIDLYNVNGKIYFGEYTFYPSSGWGRFTSDEWDKKLGEWIKL